MKLVSLVARWLYRHFLSFLVLVGLFIAAHQVQRAVGDLANVRDSLAQVNTVLVSLDAYLKNEQSAMDARVTTLQGPPIVQGAARARLVEVEKELARNRPFKPLLPPVWRPNERVDAYIENGKKELRLAILEREKQLLGAVLEGIDYRTIQQQLTDARRRQATADDALRANEETQVELKRADWLFTRWIPGTEANRRLAALQEEQRALEGSARAARENVETIQEILRQMQRRPPSSEPGPRPAEVILGPLRAQRAQLESARLENWVHKLLVMLEESGAVRAALIVLVGVVLSPLLVKSFAYYVVAPLATRRPSVRLLPNVEGRVEAPAVAVVAEGRQRAVSAVSQPLRLSPSEELFIHAEYLQRAPHGDHKRTKWLFSWKFPLTSVAAGLLALVRLRSEDEQEYEISATQDPLAEIGVLAIPPGSALALQPRSLVGVLQKRQHPMRITSHWRLASLKAWLTLQLRYLVFHGPVTLLVKGCRGVRVERAGAAHSINQSATIGFGANVDYSVSRVEVFSAYLFGKKELFNDSFSGGPGDYVYEEMPNYGKKSGLFGRGLEGIFDTILKVFGI